MNARLSRVEPGTCDIYSKFGGTLDTSGGQIIRGSKSLAAFGNDTNPQAQRLVRSDVSRLTVFGGHVTFACFLYTNVGVSDAASASRIERLLRKVTHSESQCTTGASFRNDFVPVRIAARTRHTGTRL